jgi:serine/threonine protein kinase
VNQEPRNTDGSSSEGEGVSEGTRLARGAHLGPYRIEGLIGSGGMGEVYRAIDTRLNRVVAIKVSAEEFSGRFEREALAIAALNHPNICTLHDVGHDYLVMELLEGETLASRLRKGPLPIELVLRYGAEIARALRSAHEKGIVHRDLKPANIMITKSGVKVLDFGLARVHRDETMTATNAIAGTPAYMAPEQLQGEHADARTDIYAFGLVLHEMATGRRLVPGDSLSTNSLAPTLAYTIRHCLVNDREGRWQSAADIEIALGWPADPPATARRMTTSWPWVTAALIALVSLAVVLSSLRQRPVETRPLQLQLNPPAGREFRSPDIALSPDGKYLAFVTGGPVNKLWIRALDSLTNRELPGTDGAALPFWSPDQRALGFFAGGKLKRIDLSGDRVVTLADAPAGRGGSWNADDTILFSAATNGPIWTVPAVGGAPPVRATALDSPREASHRFPEFLPDGRHFLFYVRAAEPDVRGIYRASLDNPGEKSRVVESMFTGIYAPRDGTAIGTLLRITEEGGLIAQAFDPVSGVLSGQAALVPDIGLLRMGYDRQSPLSVSRDGTLAYGTSDLRFQLTWYDRLGKPSGTIGQPDALAADSLRISPDGRRVAVSRSSDKFNIWTIDLASGESSRVTNDSGGTGGLAWSPDGRRIAYLTGGTFTGMRATVFTVNTSGSPAPVRLTNTPHSQSGPDWSVDGKFVLFQQTSSEANFDLWFVSAIDHTAKPYQETAYQEFDGRFSPDGNWLAYTANQTGRQEIWVDSFPSPTSKQQVSVDGGAYPVWRRDGNELFYRSPDGNLMAVPVQHGSGTLRFGPPTTLFPIGATAYDVSPDGSRFLTLARVRPDDVTPLTLFFNWQQKLDKRP